MQAIGLPDASRIGSRDPHRGWCNTLQRETKHDGALLILRGSVCAFKKRVRDDVCETPVPGCNV
jgi:hypothetical protein